MNKMEALEIISKLPAEELRQVLSVLAKKTPHTVYFDETFIADVNNIDSYNIGKEENGKASPIGQALMMVASTANLSEGDSLTVRVRGLKHGGDELGDYEVICNRLPKKSDNNLEEKVRVYEALLHDLQLHSEVTLNHNAVVEILKNVCSWSYAHRSGNGELSDEEIQERIDNAFEKLKRR